MSEWDTIGTSNDDGWEVSDIQGESIGEYEIKSFKTERVLDTNPNLYLQRAEQKLREGKYDEAVIEAETAVRYSNNNSEVINEYNRIKRAVDNYRRNFQSNRSDSVSSQYIVQKRNNYKGCVAVAKSYISMGKFYQALSEVNEAFSYVTETPQIKELSNLKTEIIKKKNEKIAYRLIIKAYDSIKRQKYNEALKYANDAVKYSDDKKLEYERNRIVAFINSIKQ